MHNNCRCQLPCESLGERFGARDLNMYFRILNEDLKNPRILKIAGFSLMFYAPFICVWFFILFLKRKHGRDEVWIHEIQAEKATFVAASKCWLLSAFVAAEFEVAKHKINKKCLHESNKKETE